MENTVFGKLFDCLEINVEEMIDDSLRSMLETKALRKNENPHFQNKYRRNKKGMNPLKSRRLIKRAIKVCYTDIEKLKKVMRKRREEIKGSFFKQSQKTLEFDNYKMIPLVPEWCDMERIFQPMKLPQPTQCETPTIPLESVNDVVLDAPTCYPFVPEELSSNASLKVCGKDEYVEHVVETKPTHIPEAPFPTMSIYDKVRGGKGLASGVYDLSEINMNDLRPGKHTDIGDAISEDMIRKAELSLFDADTSLLEDAFDGLDASHSLEQIEKED